MKTQHQHKLHHPGLWTAENTAPSFQLDAKNTQDASSMVIGYLDSVSNRTCQRARMASKLSETQYFLFDKNTLTSHLH